MPRNVVFWAFVGEMLTINPPSFFQLVIAYNAPSGHFYSARPATRHLGRAHADQIPARFVHQIPAYGYDEVLIFHRRKF